MIVPEYLILSYLFGDAIIIYHLGNVGKGKKTIVSPFWGTFPYRFPQIVHRILSWGLWSRLAFYWLSLAFIIEGYFCVMH